MSTTSPTNAPDQKSWTTKSQRKLSFGFIIVLASAGTGPFLMTMSIPGFILETAIILTSIWMATGKHDPQSILSEPRLTRQGEKIRQWLARGVFLLCS